MQITPPPPPQLNLAITPASAIGRPAAEDPNGLQAGLFKRLQEAEAAAYLQNREQHIDPRKLVYQYSPEQRVQRENAERERQQAEHGDTQAEQDETSDSGHSADKHHTGDDHHAGDGDGMGEQQDGEPRQPPHGGLRLVSAYREADDMSELNEDEQRREQLRLQRMVDLRQVLERVKIAEDYIEDNKMLVKLYLAKAAATGTNIDRKI